MLLIDIMNDEMNKLVDVGRIKALCAKRGIPFAEFGRRIGLPHRESISKRLQNKYKISGDELALMAVELEVPISDLIVPEVTV